jgi:hypothetical protein
MTYEFDQFLRRLQRGEPHEMPITDPELLERIARLQRGLADPNKPASEDTVDAKFKPDRQSPSKKP